MSSYVYRGKSKLYPRPVEKKQDKPLFQNIGFILCASYPDKGFKINGSKLLRKYKNSAIIDYQLDLINSVCIKPEIIITTGISVKEFVKHERREEFIIIENQLYEFSNSAEDLRLGLMAMRSPHCIFIDSGFIPTLDTFKYLLGHKDRTSKVFIKDGKDEDYVGVTVANSGYINSFSFATNNNVAGMYYINTNDINRIRKKTLHKTYAKNQFAFELIKDIKTKPVLDESESVLVTR